MSTRQIRIETGDHRVSQLAILINGFPFDSSLFRSDAEVPLVRIRDLHADKFETFVPRQAVPPHAIVQNGDVVIGMDGDFNSMLWDRGEAALNQRLCLLRARPGIDPRYIAYAVPPHLKRINELTWSTTVKHLSGGQVRAIRVPAHSQARQRAIADFLDRETAQIDAFIAKNEELITLLTERRAAVIARSVLRGLDEEPVLRCSGVAWLGGVPPHWRVSRLSRWYDVTLGKMLDESRFSSTVGELLPYIRASNIKPGQLDLSDVNIMPFTPTERSKFDLREGDLVVVEGGSIGVNAPIQGDMKGWGFQKTVNRVRAIGEDSTRFLGYQLDVMRHAGALGMLANTSTIQHLTAEKLERIHVAMPPANEQKAIVRNITDATLAIDGAIAAAEKAVQLTRERRISLISAAVTGKIDEGVTA